MKWAAALDSSWKPLKVAQSHHVAQPASFPKKMRAGVTQKPARECSQRPRTAAQGRSQPRCPLAGERAGRRACRRGVLLGPRPGRRLDSPRRARVERAAPGEAGTGTSCYARRGPPARARRGAGGGAGHPGGQVNALEFQGKAS